MRHSSRKAARSKGLLKAAPEAGYLQTCFGIFREVIEHKYKRPFDLPAIEKDVRHLCCKVPLSYADLKQFQSPEHWWFEKFWVFPPEAQIASGLKKRMFDFWGLPKAEADVIKSLYQVFKSIELVSIILRFIKPEHYGIISPPVERILDVRRGSDAVETYLNYLNDLRAIKKYYRFVRVADVEMALWVVHEKCYHEPKDLTFKKAYRDDRFLLQLRAKNLMGDFFDEYTHAEVAEALSRLNPQLSAQIGGIAFERMVRTQWRAVYDSSPVELDLKIVIDQLRDNLTIDELTYGKWHKARKVRNKAIHGAVSPSANEVASILSLLK